MFVVVIALIRHENLSRHYRAVSNVNGLMLANLSNFNKINLNNMTINMNTRLNITANKIFYFSLKSLLMEKMLTFMVISVHSGSHFCCSQCMLSVFEGLSGLCPDLYPSNQKRIETPLPLHVNTQGKRVRAKG